VYYGFEDVSCYMFIIPVSRAEHALRVCENRVLMKILGPKRDEVTEEWRKLCNEELRILYLY
jgi:hypothetical protein